MLQWSARLLFVGNSEPLPKKLLKPRKSSQNRRPVKPPRSPVEANGRQTAGPDLRAYPLGRILEALGQFLNRQ